MDKLAVTCATAALTLNVPIGKIYELTKSGELRTIGIKRGVRVLVSSINEYKFEPIEPRTFKPLPKDPDKEKGFVYLIRIGLYHKIGIARNVRSRLSSMQTGHPEALELVHSIPTNNMRRAEGILHERFNRQRVRGEWFSLMPEHVATVCEYESLMF